MSGRTSRHPEASVFPAQGPGGVIISEWTRQACVLAVPQTSLERVFSDPEGQRRDCRFVSRGHESVPESICPHHILVLTLVVSNPRGVSGSPRHHGTLSFSCVITQFLLTWVVAPTGC